MRRAIACAGLVVGELALQTAPAAADDASVWAAYTARDAEVDALVAESKRAFRDFTKHPNKRTINAVIRATRREQIISAEIAEAVQAQPSSTPAGEKGKALLVKGGMVVTRGWARYVVCFRTARRGHGKLAVRQLRIANRTLARGGRYDDRG